VAPASTAPEARTDALADVLARAVVQRQAVLQRAPLYRGMQASAPNAATPLIGDSKGFQLGVRDDEFKVDDEGNVVPGSAWIHR